MDAILRSLSVHRKHLMKLDNVIGVGVGHKHVRGSPTGERAVVVLVREKKSPKDIPEAQAVPPRVGEHSTDVIEIGHIRLLANTKRIRPAAPGCSIGHYRITAGTFGCVVRDRATNRRLILSNNHVLANITDGQDNRAKQGDPILQPGKYDLGVEPADVIARLERWAPLYRLSVEPTCPIARQVQDAMNRVVRAVRPNYSVHLSRSSTRENLTDAAVARPVSDDMITAAILDIGVPLGMATAYPGMSVQKSGRTSGLTTGKVMVIGATLNISMGDVGEATFTDQIVTTPIGQPGDSGSLVLDDQRRAIGLLAAGSDKATVCNAIDNVLDELDVTLVTGQ